MAAALGVTPGGKRQGQCIVRRQLHRPLKKLERAGLIRSPHDQFLDGA
jgi:hypothetical protein